MTLEEDIKEEFRISAKNKNTDQHQKISDSAENYIKFLLDLKDARPNGYWGIDAVYFGSTPPARFEIKTASKTIQVYDTQLYYDTDKSRYFHILVRREDKLKSYIKKKGKHGEYKVLHNFNNIESLLFNFGDIFILPLEFVKEHFIIQRTNELVGYKEKYGNSRNYNYFRAAKRKQVMRKLQNVIKRKRNGEEVSHDERIGEGLTFGKAKQMIFGCGEHYEACRNSSTFKKKHVYEVINGPLIFPNQSDKSKIFLMDYDYRIIDDIVNRLYQNQENGKNKIQEINQLKNERLSLYEKLKNNGYMDENLKIKLDSLLKWSTKDLLDDQINLFTEKSRKETLQTTDHF